MHQASRLRALVLLAAVVGLLGVWIGVGALRSQQCIRAVEATTWLDLDEDGVRDGDEPPLAGVTVVLVKDGSETTITSDEHGSAYLAYRHCEPITYSSIYVEAPPGYWATTALRLTDINSFLQPGTNRLALQFGFVREPD